MIDVHYIQVKSININKWHIPDIILYIRKEVQEFWYYGSMTLALAEKRPNGRPLKFASEQELQEKISEWEQERRAEGKPFTITSLARKLDTNRFTLWEYKVGKNTEKFTNTIQRAYDLCEESAEDKLYGNTQVAGVIFSLVNNYGWKNAQEIRNTNLNLNMELQNAEEAMKSIEEASRDK